MAEFEVIGKEFVQFYFKAFDENRAGLAALYRPVSMLTFENVPVLGTDAILEKLQNLPFTKVEHRTDTIDCQPAGQDSILVMVTGALLVEGAERPMSFTQTFQLKSEAGSWYVFNDIFRLVYPAA